MSIVAMYLCAAWWSVGCAIFLSPVLGYWPGFVLAGAGGAGIMAIWIAMGWL